MHFALSKWTKVNGALRAALEVNPFALEGGRSR